MDVSSLFPLLCVTPLLAFYFWMLSDMLRNERLSSSPWMFLGIRATARGAVDRKTDWTFAFVVLNVIAPAMY